MARCGARAHCCNLAGEVCRYLRDDGEREGARRFVCTLREALGSWRAVHADPRYVEHVRPVYDAASPTYAATMPDCSDWPPAGVKCHECGTTGGEAVTGG